MKFLTFTAFLALFLVSHLGLCQSLGQTPATMTSGLQFLSGALPAANPLVPQVNLNDFLEQAKTFSDQEKFQKKMIQMGGGDLGGGSGVMSASGELRLYDLAQCQGLKEIKPFQLKVQPIGQYLAVLEGSTVRDFFAQNIKLKDRFLSRVLLMAAFQSDWFFVNSDLELVRNQNKTLAMFKRTVGVVIDAPRFAVLRPTDQLGLLIHETLRMISIGLKNPLSESEIEGFTCRVLSGEQLKPEQFPGLQQLSERIKADTPLKGYTDLDEQHRAMLRQLNNYAQKKSGQSSVGIPGFVESFRYLSWSSRFNELRTFANWHAGKKIDLEKAFFQWAAKEAPDFCDSLEHCDYAEAWPQLEENRSVDPRATQLWQLSYFDANVLAWTQPESGFSFVTTNEIIPAGKIESYCAAMSVKMKADYQVANEENMQPLKKLSTAYFVMRRFSPSSMDENGKIGRLGNIFIGKQVGKYTFWVPRHTQLAGAGTRLENPRELRARPICIKVLSGN